jgi:hypothetical protein
MSRYILSYCSGATGYGWEREVDRLDEIEPYINEKRRDYTASVTLWDESRKDFIFWKNVLTHEPSIDDLSRCDRDYRCKDKTRKSVERRRT